MLQQSELADKEKENSPWLTYLETAARLKCGHWKLMKMVKAGTIPFHKIGHHTRFHREEIDEFILNRR